MKLTKKNFLKIMVGLFFLMSFFFFIALRSIDTSIGFFQKVYSTIIFLFITSVLLLLISWSLIVIYFNFKKNKRDLNKLFYFKIIPNPKGFLNKEFNKVIINILYTFFLFLFCVVSLFLGIVVFTVINFLISKGVGKEFRFISLLMTPFLYLFLLYGMLGLRKNEIKNVQK